MPNKGAAKSIIAIAGPTASGKTSLAVEAAIRLDAEIVNFDSVQIYRGIEIATAKPTDEEMRGVPHHLINYVDPSVNYSAGDWALDAAEVIPEIESRGKRVILVGGTGFYLRSLRQPLFDSPRTDPHLRRRLKIIETERGAQHLHRVLARVDRRAADSLDVNDASRIIRALEVFFQTGRRISDAQPERALPPKFASRIRLFVLNPPRSELYERINLRTQRHFAAGLVAEVVALRSSGLSDATNALGAHAYRRVCEYLRGERTLESAVEKSAQDVRNYAKRQFTWFRGEPDAEWIDGFGETSATLETLMAALETAPGQKP